MRLIDADRLKEQIAERIRTPRSTMEIPSVAKRPAGCI